MPDIQALFSQVNLDIHRGAVALALEAMAADGWGKAPARFSVIVMGSIGRGESLLAPDQDNGFIVEDHAEGERVVVERFFAELAGRMTAALARVGFPLCRGNVMATNPIWRMPLAGWKRQIESWIAQRSAEAILQADICFDFCAATEPALAQALRAHTLASLARGQPFLRDMCLALMDHRVALGLFGGLAAEPAGDRQRTNLKLRGLMPLVAAVRLLALREGLPDTSTLARIAALAGRGVLSGDERDELADAYRDLSYLILRQQLADLAARRPAGNLVSTAGWSRERRQRLAASLRAVEELQRRVREDFTGRVL
jgi:signal-transduction protein with cAMP-binding, CBS, and nucleotidyltransferase domain